MTPIVRREFESADSIEIACRKIDRNRRYIVMYSDTPDRILIIYVHTLLVHSAQSPIKGSSPLVRKRRFELSLTTISLEGLFSDE